MSKSTSILVIVILSLVILLMGGGVLWYVFSDHVGNSAIYEAVQGRGQEMQVRLDQRSDAIEAKLDRLNAKLDAVHGLSSRTDAQAARIEDKLDRLLKIVEKQQPAQMEPAP